MSNYIIDPMWFYWLQIIPEIKGLLEFFGLVGLFGTPVVMVLAVGVNEDMGILTKYLKHIIMTISISILCLFLTVFIPSRKTMIEMQIAKHVTYSNVEAAEKKIEEVTDYIIEKIKGDKND